LLVWTALLAWPSAACAQQSAVPRRVLVLDWYDKDYSWNVTFDRTFQDALRSAPAGPVEYYPEYLESNRFPGENQAQLLRYYLRRKYADRTIDVVVANSDASLDFLLKYRQDLFPLAPIVFVAARHPKPEELAAGPGLTGVINMSSHRKTVDVALRLHPDTEHLFVISGTLEHDRRLETQAREELQGYEKNVQISYLTDYRLDELIAQTKRLPERSLILYVWQQSKNEQGKVLESVDFLTSIARSARVPIYGMTNPSVGSGIVGGYINTADAIGTRAAEIALQIVNGARTKDIPVERATAVAMFDWRELRRWGISEGRLPSGSLVRFKRLSLWEEYKEYVVGAITLFVVQTGLIGWLLIEHRRRRRTEEERRHLSAIVESSDDAIIGTSLDGDVLSWNPGAESTYGYTAAEMLGRDLSIIIPPEQMEEFSENLKKVRSGERIKDCEIVRLKKDGTRIDVSVRISPVRDIKGRIIETASITRDISVRKRAELELEQLATRLLNLQDAERRGVARELHDVTAQNMFAISMNLSRLQRDRVEPSEAEAVLGESERLCNQALQEIRTLSYLLHPPMLDRVGLVSALKWYVEGFMKRSGINIEMLSIHEIGRLPSDIEMALFRIVQESLTNIRRHSGSVSAEIRLEKEDNQVILQIRDRGAGMAKIAETAEGVESLGIGIAGMRQRVRQFGGILEIESTDLGTVVTARVPIPNAAQVGSPSRVRTA